MFDLLGGLLGGAVSLFGADKAAEGADADRALQAWAMQNMANTQFSPQSTMTQGGAGVAFGQRPYLQLGEFAGINSLFGNNAYNQAQRGSTMMNTANQGLYQQQGIQNQANLLANLAGGQAARAARGGPQTGLQTMGQQLFGQGYRGFGAANPFSNAANNFTNQANVGFDSLRDQTLNTLRQQAQPFEERAFANLQNNQFSTGRLGSTGGALQTEAFARGLGQADLDRQLQATGVAQQQQMQTGNLANMFGSLANQTRGTAGQIAGMGSDVLRQGTALEDSLLNSAFQRFAGTSGLANDLNQSFFNRGQQTQQSGFANLAGQQGIIDSILNLGRFGANLGAQQADTDIRKWGGAGSQIAQMGPSGSDIWGGFLTNLGGNADWGGMMQGASNLFGNIFNKPGQGSGITGAPN